MEIQINQCSVLPESQDLIVSIEIRGSVQDLQGKLPEEIKEKIVSKMWCKSWEELMSKIVKTKDWIS